MVLVLVDSLRTYFKSLWVRSLSLGGQVQVLVLVLAGQVLVLVLGGQVLVLGGQVLVNIPGLKLCISSLIEPGLGVPVNSYL